MTEAEFQQLKKQNPQIRIKGEPVCEISQIRKSKPRKIAKSLMVAGQIREGSLLSLSVLLPIRTESELNRYDHWAATAARKKAQRNEVKVGLQRLFEFFRCELPCVVRLTRIGAHALDSDNLASAFKAIRDEIALLIGIDDGSELIRFEYDQVADHRMGYGIKIEILRPFQAGE